METPLWFIAKPYSDSSSYPSDDSDSPLYEAFFENYQAAPYSYASDLQGGIGADARPDDDEVQNHGWSHVTQSSQPHSWFPSVFEEAAARRKLNAPVIPTLYNPKRQKNVREWQLTTATLLDNPLDSGFDSTVDTLNTARISLSERYAAIPQSTRLRHKRACGDIGFRRGRCSCLNDTLRKTLLVRLHRHRRIVSKLHEMFDDEELGDEDSSSSSSDEEEDDEDLLALKPGFEKALLQLDGGKKCNESEVECGDVRINVAVYNDGIGI